MNSKPFKIEYLPGATLLTAEEREELIPDYISTHGELNELEQQNIQNAVLWLHRKRKKNILDQGFVYELHKQMFNEVWSWAGNGRTSGKNIGIDWHHISTQLAQLIADTRFWIEHQSFSFDEIATRFHHRLVQIHVFPNGNGRHARLMTDLLLEAHDHPAFSWGMNASPTPIENESDRRKNYISALKAADQRSYAQLLAFVRS